LSTQLQHILKNIPFQIIGDKNAVVSNVSIDSRSLQNNNNTLFFALKGKNNDAHTYIPELLEKGIENFVVSTLPKDHSKGNYILVDNTLKALQQSNRVLGIISHVNKLKEEIHAKLEITSTPNGSFARFNL